MPNETSDWEIEVVNPNELAEFSPDCVKITILIGKIKQALAEGREVRGVKAKKILVANQRAEKSVMIEV